ncbi:MULTISPECIES: hypothetical protein [Acidocella]|uniref:hypothetical protein n=2 Tax=Acidocellaceae TaxID=3385905 RepID=UPI00028EAA9C|nr:MULTISPECIES: hypothetical protein [Acidocella]EKM98532.1 hypothetical protein MXAZACID_15009 [Acidocella sp. MX-AZ02]
MHYSFAATTFHWVFISLTLVLCVVASLPTRAWLGAGAWLQQQMTRSTSQRLQASLAPFAGRFSQSESFFARGGGLAFDAPRGLVFLASMDGLSVQSAIYPAALIEAAQARCVVENGFQDFVLDVGISGQAAGWRLRCASQELANEMSAALARFCGTPDQALGLIRQDPARLGARAGNMRLCPWSY